MEPAHLVRRSLDRAPEIGRQRIDGRVEDRVGDDEPVAHVHTIEPCGQLDERRVAVPSDARQRLDDPRTSGIEVDTRPRHAIAWVAAIAAQVEHAQTGHDGSDG